jgi:hypothetical protein
LAFYKQCLHSDNWTKNVADISKPMWDFKNDYPTLKNKDIYPTYDQNNNLIDYTDFYSHFD